MPVSFKARWLVALISMLLMADATTFAQPSPEPIKSDVRTAPTLAKQTQSNRSWAPGTITLLTISRNQGGHTGPVRAVTFSSDGQFLASGGADKITKVWNLQARNLARSLPHPSAQINTMAFSPNNQFLAVGALDGSIQIWQWPSGSLVKTLEAHSDVVTAVLFSPNSQRLISASGDKHIKLWDLESGHLVNDLETSQWITALAQGSDSNTIASSGLQTVELWDIGQGRLIRSFGRFPQAIYAIAFSPDGNRLAFSPDSLSNQQDDRHNTIQFWTLNGQRVDPILRAHRDYVLSLAFSPDGQLLLSGSWDKTVKLWDVSTGHIIRDFLENDQRILSVAFSPNNRAFAIGSGDGTVKIWESDE